MNREFIILVVCLLALSTVTALFALKITGKQYDDDGEEKSKAETFFHLFVLAFAVYTLIYQLFVFTVVAQ